jgi:hypothetical protein
MKRLPHDLPLTLHYLTDRSRRRCAAPGMFNLLLSFLKLGVLAKLKLG